MFCKIAVANGMVTEEQAKKCLAIANKREQETGRRPQVGAIFSKYNLLRRQDVQMVYDAVNKRLAASGGGASGRIGVVKGAANARAGAIPATARGREAAVRPRGRRGYGYAGREEREVARKVDPTTLWVGIAFGVIFVGIVIGIVVMFFSAGMRRAQETGTTDVAGKTEASPGSTAKVATTGASGSSGGGATGAGAGGAAASGTGAQPGETPAGGKVLADPDQEGKIRQWIHDALDKAQADEAGALALMEKLRQEVAAKNLQLSKEVEFEIDDLYQDLKRRVQQGGQPRNGGAAPGGAADGAAGGGGETAGDSLEERL